MMPTRWVSVSPNVTISSGVDDRSIAAVQCPTTTMSSMTNLAPPGQAAGSQSCNKQQALQDGSARAGDLAVKLQRIAGRDQSADQDRDRHGAQEMLARQPRHQKAGQPVTDRQAGLQPALNRRRFANTGKAGERAADRHYDQRVSGKVQPDHSADFAVTGKDLEAKPQRV